MKVAYLLGSLNRGGAENLILDIFQNSDQAPFDFIGISRKTGFYSETFRHSDKQFFQCSISHHNILSYLLRLRKLLKSNNISIVHAQQSLDAILARFATIGTDIKIILTIHSIDLGHSKSESRLKKLAIRISNKVFFVSNYQYDYYKQHYNLKTDSKYHVIYNGINFSKLIQREYRPFSNKIQIGTVGSFRSGRDQFFICTFLNYLKQQGTDFDFFFIGPKISSEPKRYDDCVQYVNSHHLNDNVHFLGGCDNVPILLSQLDLFIYCSEHDTFGIAVLEAIASSVPTLVNDWPVMSEITENGRFATIYQTNNIEDLYDKFTKLLQTPTETLKHATENARLVREKYSIISHLNNLNELYNTL